MKDRVLSGLKGSAVVLFVQSISLLLLFLSLREPLGIVEWSFFQAIFLVLVAMLFFYLFRNAKNPWIFMIATVVSQIAFSFVGSWLYDNMIRAYYRVDSLAGIDAFDLKYWMTYGLHTYFACLVGICGLFTWFAVTENRQDLEKKHLKDRVFAVLKSAAVVLSIHAIMFLLMVLHLEKVINDMLWLGFVIGCLTCVLPIFFFLFENEKHPWIFLITTVVSQIAFSLAGRALCGYIMDKHYQHIFLAGIEYLMMTFGLHVYFACLVGICGLWTLLTVMKSRREHKKKQENSTTICAATMRQNGD